MTRLVFLLAALIPVIGCKAKIGDPCQRSTDCSLQGDRVCDLSHRVNGAGVVTTNGRGECTVESCGHDDCPKEAECVKVYGSDFLTKACDPAREDRATELEIVDDVDREDCLAAPGCLEVDGSCVCPPLDSCDPNEVCLPEGLCADEITARTSCRRRCADDGDCRAGYECIKTGGRGIYPAPNLDRPGRPRDVKICAPESE